MSEHVLDASAVLALLNQEHGSDPVVQAIIDGASISAVNLSEIVAKLSEAGVPVASIHEALDRLGIEVVDFDADLAYRAGLLRPVTRPAGLSLGDRACLALAQQLGLPALTTARAWTSLQIGVTIRLAR